MTFEQNSARAEQIGTRPPPGWERIDGTRSKLAARWRHASGWTIHHCGHPTANYPWALYSPAGDLTLTGVLGPARRPDFGVAWRTLAQAWAYVEHVLARRAA